MRKISLALIGFFVLFLGSVQAQNQPKTDSLQYEKRKLKIEEVNFTSSYYQQDGNNSAVTGGIGTEKVTDFATTLELKMARFDKNGNKHNFNFEFGLDVYTSASSDKIDPNTVSSASKGDQRIYPSVNYQFQNIQKKYGLGGGLSFSNEYDYTSFGINTAFVKSSKDNNREISVKASVFLDSWTKVILPVELRPAGYGSGSEEDELPVDSRPRNSYNLGLSFSQVINRNLQMAILIDFAQQTGLLGTKFHRVYFADGSLRTENLPNQRFKIPIGLRMNYFLGDRMVLRGFYRYYWDTWQMQAHTLQSEIAYKITPFMSFSPYYRFYTQTAVKDFAAYQQHQSNEEFYTSDFDLSQFQSHFFGLNLRFHSAEGLLGIKKFNTLEIRYGHYERSTNLNSNIVSVAMTFK